MSVYPVVCDAFILHDLRVCAFGLEDSLLWVGVWGHYLTYFWASVKELSSRYQSMSI